MTVNSILQSPPSNYFKDLSRLIASRTYICAYVTWYKLLCAAHCWLQIPFSYHVCLENLLEISKASSFFLSLYVVVLNSVSKRKAQWPFYYEYFRPFICNFINRFHKTEVLTVISMGPTCENLIWTKKYNIDFLSFSIL